MLIKYLIKFIKTLNTKKMVLKGVSGLQKLFKFFNIDFIVGKYTNTYSTILSPGFARATNNLLNQNVLTV